MKNILIVGSGSFVAKNVVDKLKPHYNCVSTSRSSSVSEFHLDIESEDSIISFCEKNNTNFWDGILFFQGINPSKNAKEITTEHFVKMLTVNLVGPAILLKHLYKNLNVNSMILFISSIAAQKGSYDPSYASAKAGINGLVQSLANEFPDFRFNTLSLGLVENSPVFNNMTLDFRQKHAERMNNKFVQVNDVSSAVYELLRNLSINKTTLNIDGGFKN